MFMTINVLKNLVTKYATRLYPFTKRETFKDVKGELKIEMEKCILCGVCQMRCPSQCIVVNKQGKSWQVDPFSCVYCGICVDACPVKCLYQERMYRAPLAEKDIVMHVQQEKEPAPQATP
jgi:ech hydrogenase subunit F